MSDSLADPWADFRSALVDADENGQTFAVIASPSERIAALLADRDHLARQVEAVKALATAKGRETWSTVSEYDRGYRDGRTDAFAEVTTTIRALEGES